MLRKATPKPRPAARLCSIVLDGTVVPYTLQLTQRRSVGFLIADEGLIIRAPFRISPLMLDEIIQGKKQWLLKKLYDREHQQKRWARLEQRVEDGEPVPVLGQYFELHYRDKPRKVEINLHERLIWLPTDTPKAPALLTKQLQQLALATFQQLADALANNQNLGEFTIHLSSPKHRWGSCNSRREIRLNWRLIHYPQHFIEYVIAHELAHLVHMNHSAKFWATVERLLPNYQAAHKTLAGMNPAMVPIDPQISLS